MPEPIFLSPIIKVASTCNLDCDYCSADQYMEDNSDAMMQPETLRRTIEELSRVQHRGKFLWHGGEPLLAGRKFYDTVIEIQEELQLRDRFGNTMQSNGVLFTDSWADFFAENDFSIGFSIDGPEAMHNELRVFHNGAGSHKQVMHGIKRAHNNGLKSGVLVVITKQSVRHAKKIFSFLVESGFKSMDFKPCYGSPGYDVSLLDYAQFINTIFDMWVELDDPDVRIRTIEGFIRNMLGSNAQACSQTGNCANLITIDYDGEVYPCDRFIEPDYHFGNINLTPLDELYNESEGAIRFRAHIDEQRKSCQNCSYQPVCKSGCTQERDYWPAEYCTHREIIIDHIRDWLIEEGETPVSVS